MIKNNTTNGWIELICGPMFSGKTEELIRRLRRSLIAKKKVIIFKPYTDNRYSENKIVTHDNNQYDAIKCEKLQDIEKLINDYEVICIDEIQFYSDAAEYCDKWANNDKIIEVCGLNGDYKRESFEQISLLIPIVENITFLTAIDEKTGEEACFTKRIIDSKELQLIGGKETYIACSRDTYKL